MKLARQELLTTEKDPKRFPNCISTMYFHVAEDQAVGERMVRNVLSPTLSRSETELSRRLLFGPAEVCAEKLAAYQSAGAQHVDHR